MNYADCRRPSFFICDKALSSKPSWLKDRWIEVPDQDDC